MHYEGFDLETASTQGLNFQKLVQNPVIEWNIQRFAHKRERPSPAGRPS